jgi:hypothetical protein
MWAYGVALPMVAIYPFGIPLLYSVLLWVDRKELNPDPRSLVAEILNSEGGGHEMYVLAKEAGEMRKLAETEAVCGEQMHARAKDQQNKEIEAAKEKKPARGLSRSISAAAIHARAIQETPPLWQLAFPCQAAYVAALTDASSILDAKLIELARRQNPKIQHIAFLWSAYRCNCFMWEAAECLRRLMLTGMLILVEPGTISQIVVAAFIALFWVGAYGKCVPFIDEGADTSGTIAQYVTFTTLFVAVLIEANVVAGSSTFLLTIFMISLNMTPMGRLYFCARDEYRKYRHPAEIVLDQDHRPRRRSSVNYGDAQLREQTTEADSGDDGSNDAPTYTNHSPFDTNVSHEEIADGPPTASLENDTGALYLCVCGPPREPPLPMCA